MKSKVVSKTLFMPEQREQLRLLLAAVDPDADEHAPAFLALLDAWEQVKAPWNLMPTVKAYRCHGGSWLTAGVNEVLRAIYTHIGDTTSALNAYKRDIGG